MGKVQLAPLNLLRPSKVSDRACTHQKSEDEALIRLYRGYDGRNVEFHWVNIISLSLDIVLILLVDFLNIPSLIS
jgi:hypothetical protein